MILVDSNFFIALINEKDQYHKRAIELSKEIMYEDDKIVPLLMLSEVVSSLSSRCGGKIAKIAYETIIDNFTVYFPDERDIKENMNLDLKYNSLSLADCLAVYLMKEKEMVIIYSFDSDFDKVNGILRKS